MTKDNWLNLKWYWIKQKEKLKWSIVDNVILIKTRKIFENKQKKRKA
jgi:hypothetical protein